MCCMLCVVCAHHMYGMFMCSAGICTHTYGVHVYVQHVMCSVFSICVHKYTDVLCTCVGVVCHMCV